MLPGGMRRWLAVSAWCAVVFSLQKRGRADEEPPFLIALDTCDELNEADVRRITAAELGARPTTEPGLDVTVVNVTCTGARVTIRVHDPLSRKNVRRSFDLELSDPRARDRLVSLAATELVLASWAELQASPKLRVEPEGPKPPPATVHAAQRIAQERVPYVPKIITWADEETPADRMFRIVGLVSTRSFFGHGGALWGGGVRVGEERFRFVGWSADLLVERGTLSGPDGPYDVFTTTLGGGLFAALQTRFVTARLGAGLRLGTASATLRGDPSAGSALVPWGWPLGGAQLSFRLASSLVLDLAGEGGYAVLPLGDNAEHSLSGGWYSLQAGLGFVPFPPASASSADAPED